MGKKLLALLLVLIVPAVASAGPNVGGCGWGSKLMDGSEGIAPQVLAVTTNGTSGNQTFGISSGTSGCSQNGVVRSNWKTAMYIDSNMNKLARDMSRGHGESLDSLAVLLGMEESDKGVFYKEVQANFDNIFPSVDTNSVEVRDSLRYLLAGNRALEQYAESI